MPKSSRLAHVLSYVAILISIGTLVFVSVTGDDSRPQEVPTIALCTQEDGSSQGVCWWHDKANGWYLNIEHGHAMYVPRTGDLITY